MRYSFRILVGFLGVFLTAQLGLAQTPPRCSIRFLGAAGYVAGSMHLLNANGRRVLVDCGLQQGRPDSAMRNQHVPREAAQADAVIVTHGHMDHVGSLPTLVKEGFTGKIHCTEATASLCRAMLLDSARVQQRQAKERDKHKHAGQPGWRRIEPAYTEQDVEAALERIVGHPYGAEFEPVPGVRASFVDAGHVLGSASVTLDVPVPTGRRRIAFSGDIGRKNSLLLNSPTPPARPDYVVMESTYGGRCHAPAVDMKQQLFQVIEDAKTRGGKVVIPSFSLQRTQELLFLLSQLKHEGRLQAPVYVDSPLSTELTEIFRQYPGCLNAQAQEFRRRGGDPFSFPGLSLIRGKEESIALNRSRGPAVIIASAGMCNAGRILHHLSSSLEGRENTVAIVGYQGEGTLGRMLVDGKPQISIFGKPRTVRAAVRVLTAFSGHADQNELLEWNQACGPQVKRTFLVHGDPEQSRELANKLEARGRKVHVPAENDTVEIE